MKIAYTAAQINFKYDERKNDYISGYNCLKNIIDENSIYVVESYLKDFGIFKDFAKNVFISNTHNQSIRNKGILEIMCLKKFLNQANFNEEELICKLTGRYSFIDNYFFKEIEKNKDFDFYGKLVDNETQIFTGCFCMKNKFLIKFLNEVDLFRMETESINMELEVFNFVKKNNLKSIYLNNLSIKAPIFGAGNIQTIYL